MAREIAAPTRVIPRQEEKAVKIVTLKSLVARRFFRHHMAVIGLCIIVFMVIYAFGGPFLNLYAPDQVNLRERFAQPSLVMVPSQGTSPALYNIAAIQGATADRPLKFGHPLGTDDLGRDTMVRAMYGGRVSLGIGFVVSIFAILVGSLFGSVSGYLGGTWDNVMMRVVDVNNAMPDIPILMVLSKVFPPGFWTMCLILTVISMLRSARLVRVLTLSLKRQLFSEASQALGANWARLIYRHIIPNSLSPLFVTLTLGAGYAIRAETQLSYLGLGIQPPMPSWGNMLSNAQQYFFSAPWLVFFPGFCIFLTLFAFNLVGDGLRDAFDPRMTRR